ncbi:MAG: copper resistance protein NlpE [Sphingobacteriales bacterium]
MVKQLFIIGSVVLLASCGGQQASVDKPTVVDSVVADTIVSSPAVTVSHYAGTLPCADCAGVQTELILQSDNTWSMHIIYDKRPSKGPGSNEFNESGKWMMHGNDTVHLMGRTDAPSMYIKTDSSLIQLGMDGKKIEGKLADKYVLKKM